MPVFSRPLICAWLLLLKAASADVTVSSGTGGRNVCPADSPWVINWCASGDDNSCYNTQTGQTCTTSDKMFPGMAEPVVISTTGKGWVSSTHGFVPCPAGQVMAGHCGSHTDKHCYADNGYGVYSLYCLDLNFPYTTTAMEKHTPTMDHVVSCPAGQITCGLCHSGTGKDCEGKVNQVGCCGAINCTPTRIVGEWVPVKVGTSAGEKVITITGVDVGAGVTLTNTMGVGMSMEIDKGFSFVGFDSSVEVTGKYVNIVSKSAAAAISLSKTVASEAFCNIAPYTMWQFVLSIEGQCGMKVFLDAYACTKNAAAEPCCVPGYSLDTEYNECVPNSPTVCETGNATANH